MYRLFLGRKKKKKKQKKIEETIVESAKEVLFARNAEKVLSRERSHVVAIKISSRAIREFTEVKVHFLAEECFPIK